jgi:rhomboid protease GluP
MGATSFDVRRTPRYAQTTHAQKAPRFFVPWVTALLIGVFCTIYFFETRVALEAGLPSGQPGVRILVVLGGLSRNLLDMGEAYRILSAPLLHSSWAHLIGNVVVFAFAGILLEWQVGAAWMFCVFAAGALAGSGMSVLVNLPTTVSVGASGAIMAMLAALFWISFRLPASRAKTRNQRLVLGLIVSALLPLAHGSGTPTDYACHLGGVLLGSVLGLLLLLTWMDGARWPSLRPGAYVLAACALFSFASAANAVARAYPNYEPLVHLMPDALVPHTPADVAAKADHLLATYPNDPRSHFTGAGLDLMNNNPTEAEAELRKALSLSDAKVGLVYPALNNTIRGLLAQTVLLEGRTAEARAIATDACFAQGVNAPPPAIMAQLEKAKLCGFSATK